jgi:hypothetical protein
MPEVRQVKAAEAGQRHPRMANHEVILGPTAPSTESGTEVEGLSAPFREHRDRVVEGAGITRTQFE